MTRSDLALGFWLARIVAGLMLGVVGAAIATAMHKPEWWRAQSRLYRYVGLPVLALASVMTLVMG
jgi:hypothetical protein